MKKLLSLILALVMLFAVFTVSACDDTTTGDTSNVPIDFGGENSDTETTGGKPNSKNSQTTSSDSDVQTPSYTAENPTSSQGGAKPSADFSFSNTGSGYAVPKTSVDPSLELPVRTAIGMINGIGYVDGSVSCGSRISTAEQNYNELTSAQKSAVTNASHLTEARNAFDNIAADNFKAAVAQLTASFAVTEQYKLLLAKAESLYSNISSGKLSYVAAEKTELARLTLLYGDTAFVNEMKSVLAGLPSVEAIQASDKVSVKKLKAWDREITATQKALFDNYQSTSATIQSYVAKLDSIYPEYVWICANERKGNTFFSTTAKLSTTGDGGDLNYEGTAITNGVKVESKTISFVPQYDGILTIYSSCKKDGSTYKISQGSTVIKEIVQPTHVDNSTIVPVKYEIPISGAGGKVSITHVTGDRTILFVLVFC